jgi:hypothetical protein
VAEIALGGHGGSGAAVRNAGGDEVAADGDSAGGADVAEDEAGGVDPPAHTCGRLDHFGGSRDATSAVLPAVAVRGAGDVAVTTVAITAVLGEDFPGNHHPSPSMKITSAPFRSA